LWLLLFALIIAFSPRIISSFNRAESAVFTYTDIEHLNQEVDRKKTAYIETKKDGFSSSKYQVPISKFNPNDYSVEDWVDIGLSEKQAEVILKFTKRKIYSNEELKRIFVLPDELYELIKDSTYYPTNGLVEEKENHNKNEKVWVDLNIANEDELMSIPGIGPFYAKKIIEHRDLLGGYIGREQLLEIWKFDQEKLSKIESYIFLSKIELTRIDINNASFNELKSHPYIDYSVANSIVKMREQRKYEEIEGVMRSKLIDRELFEKIKPYIRIDK
jgi:DNA uptake protein ComE-like DNA-binding protein